MATHVFRVTHETGANGRRGIAPGFYVSVRCEDSGNAPGAWLFMTEAAATEAEAIDAARAGMKARGVTGSARLERPETGGGRRTVSGAKPKETAKRKSGDWRAKIAARNNPERFRAWEVAQAPSRRKV